MIDRVVQILEYFSKHPLRLASGAYNIWHQANIKRDISLLFGTGLLVESFEPL